MNHLPYQLVAHHVALDRDDERLGAVEAHDELRHLGFRYAFVADEEGGARREGVADQRIDVLYHLAVEQQAVAPYGLAVVQRLGALGYVGPRVAARGFQVFARTGDILLVAGQLDIGEGAAGLGGIDHRLPQSQMRIELAFVKLRERVGCQDVVFLLLVVEVLQNRVLHELLGNQALFAQRNYLLAHFGHDGPVFLEKHEAPFSVLGDGNPV